MKKIISVLVLLLVFSSVSFGQIDTEYGKTLKKMLELSGSQGSYKVSIKKIFTVLQKSYTDLGEEELKKIENEFEKNALTKLIKLQIPIYQKYLTQQDLEHIIEFYQSPTGQKFGENAPLIKVETLGLGNQWVTQISEDFKKKMKKKGH